MRTAWILVSLVALLLWDCGSGPTTEGEGAAAQPSPQELEAAWKQAREVIDSELAKVKEKEAASFPCSLFEQQEVEELAGNSLDTGYHTFEHRSEDDHKWRSDNCAWSALRGDDAEVDLWVSLPRHFDGGAVACIAPAGADTGSYSPQSTSGIGDSAWWDYDKSWGMGTLRVCAAEALLEVAVDLPVDDRARAEELARSVAERVLQRI